VVDADEAQPSFADLGVLSPLTTALADVGITVPFAIQQLTIPVALTGADVIGQARTGTGKTLAFGLPLLQRIVAPDEPGYVDVATGKPQALVVTPTRELAIQVAADLVSASSRRRMRILTVYGGRAYEPQLEALRAGVDVIVGTPGRLLDLANQGQLDLSHVRVLVLDEADEMLDLGFLPDVERIIARTHELRQTMLFSATMPGQVVSLARRYLRHPVNVRAQAADETATVPTTAQFVYRAHRMDKDEMVARLLQAENRGLVMIFATTKRQAQRLAEELEGRGFAVAAVHGDLGQAARERALRAFRSGKVDVLVATDVAARGIDVEGVTHVVNLSCPEDEKAYLHRIGRTGRAGASGIAVTLVDWEDIARWKAINAALGLPFPDPAETYSTSEQFAHDLGIPRGTTGRLPRAQRTRAGLEAEELEDLGETGRAGRPGGGSGQRRSDGSGRDGGHGGRGRDGQGRRDRDGQPRRERRRRGVGQGRPDERSAAPAAVTAPSGAPPGSASGTATSASSDTSGEAPAGSTPDTTPIAASAGADSAASSGQAATGTPRKRSRRRRRGSGSGGAGGSAGGSGSGDGSPQA
jgi:superfamily II DNA/RNA helicase